MNGKGIRGCNPRTTYIAYGAETRKSQLSDDDVKFTAWLNDKGLKEMEYYLIVGRFVPENNYETMIREFTRSHSKKPWPSSPMKTENFYLSWKKSCILVLTTALNLSALSMIRSC